MSYSLIFTNIGLTKKQNAELGGDFIEITEFAVGDGVISDLQPTMTGLISEKYRGDINNVDTKNGTSIFDLIVPSTVGGFYVREVALFDIDGDCICIGTIPVTYKVSQDEGASKSLHIKVTTTSTNTEQITFNTDESLVYATMSYVNNHINNKSNPHAVTKAQVGLGNVDNTSDMSKPISTSQAAALALKSNITDIQNNLTTTVANKPLSANQGRILKGYIDNINTLLQSDASTLDTLQEIVDFIELNRADLNTLGISNIAGLQTALNGKQPVGSYVSISAAQALHPSDALRISGNRISLYKGDSSYEYVDIPRDIYVVDEVLGVNGWREWSDGFIEQWGKLDGNSLYYQTVYFPRAFPNELSSLSTSIVNWTTNYSGQASGSPITIAPTTNPKASFKWGIFQGNSDWGGYYYATGR